MERKLDWRGGSLDSRTEKEAVEPELTCRRRTLKVINSRPVLIAICTFVVIECACVLAELMVDLQGIKFRFENEENELNQFVAYLKKNHPDEFATWKEASSVEDVVNRIKEHLVVHSPQQIAAAVNDAPCTCARGSQEQPRSGAGTGDSGGGGSGSYGDAVRHSVVNSQLSNNNKLHLNSSLTAAGGHKVPATSRFNADDLFVLEINNVKESFFLVAEYLPKHVKLNETKHHHYESAYERIHKASTALHITSLVILSFMVIETIIKFVCMGTAFLKKKFEVFDAFIVISSFALDFVFLDSRWYETGKDAATILVLLLPWRVVRIVNSFLMTVKHKHHIEMMTIKRAKKRADFKNAKLQTLLTEIRKDVQLLVALCRNSRLPESEITACLYGLGRRSTTLNAVTSCTTIMLVSALGKDASVEDEIYGRLFADALRDPGEHDSEPEAKKLEEEAIDAAIELDKQIEQQNKKAARQATKPRIISGVAGGVSGGGGGGGGSSSGGGGGKRGGARGQVTRSYTVPRRSASIDNNIESGCVDGGGVGGVGGGGGSGSGVGGLSCGAGIGGSSSGGGGSNGANGGDGGSIFYVNDAFATHRASEKAKRRSEVSSAETLAGLAGGGVGGAGAGGGGLGGGANGGGPLSNSSNSHHRGLPMASEDSEDENFAGGGGCGGGGGGGGGGGCPGDETASVNGGLNGNGNGGGGPGGSKDSWEGRMPPKCKSKASVRSLPGPGPGQSYVTLEVTTQVTYL